MTTEHPLGPFQRQDIEDTLHLAGHALNANNGQCDLIENVLTRTTSLCCQALERMHIEENLLAACEAALPILRGPYIPTEQFDGYAARALIMLRDAIACARAREETP